eukprot:scaffold5065_cov134-Skeletonema_marinoi.AAC.1
MLYGSGADAMCRPGLVGPGDVAVVGVVVDARLSGDMRSYQYCCFAGPSQIVLQPLPMARNPICVVHRLLPQPQLQSANQTNTIEIASRRSLSNRDDY